MTVKSQECRSDCPIAYALDFVGDKWTLLVLRDLILSQKRYFQEFLASNEQIASNILASRLKLFERAGLVTRADDPEHGRRVIYTPTEKALDLLPVILEILRWGAKYAPENGTPAELMRSMKKDRDGFIAEVRARHAVRRTVRDAR
ncbi:MAG: helix-turn-helix domain-containing protein [Pseudomonadota bacterium]